MTDYPFLGPRLDDTTVAVSATSIIEQHLKLALISRFRRTPTAADMAEVFGTSGPLGTFNAKVRMCCAMGLIPADSKSDLQILGQIRNLFAHSAIIPSFADLEVTKLATKLKLATELKAEIDLPAKRQFLESSVRLILNIALSSTALLAESNFVSKHRDKISQNGKALLQEVIAKAQAQVEQQ